MYSLTSREYQLKTFDTLSGFWLLMGGVWVNQLKRKICEQNLSSDNVDWSSKKLWKMISADENACAYVKQEIKLLVALTYKFL